MLRFSGNDMTKKLTPIKKQIARGELFTLEGAAFLSDYSVQHLRRLCRARVVAHKQKGCHIYFTPAQVLALTKDVRPLKRAAVANRRGAYA